MREQPVRDVDVLPNRSARLWGCSPRRILEHSRSEQFSEKSLWKKYAKSRLMAYMLRRAFLVHQPLLPEAIFSSLSRLRLRCLHLVGLYDPALEFRP
jgi:hypothetical protein